MNAAQRRLWREYVYGCTALKHAERLVLLALEARADYRDGTNARPGVEELARMCALKPRIVEYALAHGRELNLIEQTARANPKRGLCAVYRLILPTDFNPHQRADTTGFNPHGGADRNGFNPHKTEFQPAQNDVSTRIEPGFNPHAGAALHSLISNPLSPTPELQKNISRADKGTRLPPDWEPPTAVTDELRKSWPHINITKALEEFRDYWCATPGARGRKTDWVATFRNRLRVLEERRLEKEQRNNRYANGGNGANTHGEKVAGVHTASQEALEALLGPNHTAITGPTRRELM